MEVKEKNSNYGFLLILFFCGLIKEQIKKRTDRQISREVAEKYIPRTQMLTYFFLSI